MDYITKRMMITDKLKSFAEYKQIRFYWDYYINTDKDHIISCIFTDKFNEKIIDRFEINLDEVVDISYAVSLISRHVMKNILELNPDDYYMRGSFAEPVSLPRDVGQIKADINSMYGVKLFKPYEKAVSYCKADVQSTIDCFNKLWRDDMYLYKLPKIEKVIFSKPATIVIWGDNTKTVVKAIGEAFDEEKGLAMAIAKKALGNKGNYFDEFKKWLPKIDAEPVKE